MLLSSSGVFENVVEKTKVFSAKHQEQTLFELIKRSGPRNFPFPHLEIIFDVSGFINEVPKAQQKKVHLIEDLN